MGYYTAELKIPSQFITYFLNIQYVEHCFLFTLLFFLIGSFFPSFHAASLSPVEAMRPPISLSKDIKILAKITISPLKKIFLRELLAHRVKSIGTILVIGLILSFGLSFALSIGSFYLAIEKRFDKNELWDIRVKFTNLMNTSSILNTLKNIQGVRRAEACSVFAAWISYMKKEAFIQLYILQEDTTMHKFSFYKGRFCPDGLIVSGDVAYKLGLSIGEEVNLSTPYGINKIKVSGITQEIGSSEGYIFKNLTSFNGALLKIENDKKRQIENSLKNLPYIKVWVTKKN